MKQKEDRCCGNCCWFVFEDSVGCGTCMLEYPDYMANCSDDCYTGNFVSRQEMRHHMAVLLQEFRYLENPVDRYTPLIHDSVKFAYKYMKTLSKL